MMKRIFSPIKNGNRNLNYSLEEKDFDLLLQKDVNNYIAVKGEKIICKGRRCESI